jgi:hypothetical protein
MESATTLSVWSSAGKGKTVAGQEHYQLPPIIGRDQFAEGSDLLPWAVVCVTIVLQANKN